MARARTTKRRSRGEGGAYEYRLKNGETRWRAKGLVTLPDGTVKEVNKRGFLTKTATKDSPPGTAALQWLAEQQAAGPKGAYVEASRVTLGAYGRELIETGMRRIRPQTRASYLKVWRNHVEPYPIAKRRLGQVPRRCSPPTTGRLRRPAALITARAKRFRQGRRGTCMP